MTTQAFQRAQAREQKIWPAFIYSAAFNAEQNAERVLVYGLYSGAYRNMHNYLADIEATSLENLLDDYNSKVAELDTQETMVLNSIVARRYLAGIDVLMNDQKLAVRELKRQAEEAEWDAKMEALEADRAALATLQLRLSAEEKRTEARIAELQSQIAIEEMSLSLVEIEKTEKEIRLAEMDLKILRSAIEIAKIQTSIVQEGMNLIETELRKQRLKVDIAQLKNQIARTSTMEAQLDVAIANVAAARAELAAMEAELAAIESRQAIIDAEISHQADLMEHATTMGDLRESLLELQTAGRVRKLEDQVTKNGIVNANRLDMSDMERIHALSNRRISEADTDAMRQIMYAQLNAAQRIMEANIDAATTRQENNIVNQLTHGISTGGI